MIIFPSVISSLTHPHSHRSISSSSMLLISTSIDWRDDPTDPSLMISYLDHHLSLLVIVAMVISKKISPS
nr:MAG TPA: hypothetical protein [Caudoviricetes sp.]